MDNDKINELKNLISRYKSHRSDYTRQGGSYSEAEVRADFIDEYFVILGWDIRNREGRPQRYRDVLRETRINVDERIKRPDYEFRLSTKRKFYIEAKKPSIDISNSKDVAFQIRQYGWSGGVPISAVTNFEQLIVYDTTRKPKINEGPEHSRLYIFNIDDYVNCCDEISKLFSRDSVYSENYDVQFTEIIDLRQRESIDDVFLGNLNIWRIDLAKEIVRIHPQISEKKLNEIVQRLIHRILFLRMCEDRGIQEYEKIKNVVNSGSWSDFLALLSEADSKYDSSLFDVSTRSSPLVSGQK